MTKRQKQQTYLAAVQLHERRKRVIFFTSDLRVAEEIPLGKDPLQKGIHALMQRQPSICGLVAVFGARRFSLTRTAALLVNVCNFLWRLPTASICTVEDANTISVRSALAGTCLKQAVLVVPDYVFPPHITQKKK